MKKVLFALLVAIAIPANGSHIVGGEFELIHISGSRYQLNLIYYFDELHGEQQIKTEERTIFVRIFRYSDSTVMTTISMPWISETPVPYTQPACSNDKIIKTSRQLFSIEITLEPGVYNDPEGYYVIWERCCRNYSIDNIINQQDTTVVNPPDAAGQTFYLRFPPVVRNGKAFVNSSPHLFPPLSDYGCPHRPYYVNFAGVDDDNDSLAYSMTTPWDTETHLAVPVIGPGPYPDVQWIDPPYNMQNIVGGDTNLKISRDGLLTVIPNTTGLFVFAVRVEEFRNGVKIGETRRDFQLFVTDDCTPDQPPLVKGKKLTDATFGYIGAMQVSFDNTVTDANRCIVVQVSDPDSQNAARQFTEHVSIRAVPLNFKNPDLGGIVLPSQVVATLTHGSTSEFKICLPECPFLQAPYQIGIIALDDACSLPMMDTLKVTINQQPPSNTNAYFLGQKLTAAQLNEGSSSSWPFAARDDDGDNLTLSVIADGFELKDAGMTYTVLHQQAGSADGTLGWDAFCKIYDFTQRTDFTVDIVVDDQDKCNLVNPDTVVFQLQVILPKFDPQLTIYNAARSLNLTGGQVEMNLGHLALDLVGVDQIASAKDTLMLALVSGTGNVTPSGYRFTAATGFNNVESTFTWDTDCSIFRDADYDNSYQFKFAVENRHCKTPKADTAFVNVRIKDIPSRVGDFVPANVITTYADHCNDFFAIDGFDDEPPCGSQVRAVPFVPIDNCANWFEHVKIYDRWGKLVFESTDRKFRWYAETVASGVYYYIIKFSAKEYKSSLTVFH